jgi:hypothetical protein
MVMEDLLVLGLQIAQQDLGECYRLSDILTSDLTPLCLCLSFSVEDKIKDGSEVLPCCDVCWFHQLGWLGCRGSGRIESEGRDR